MTARTFSLITVQGDRQLLSRMFFHRCCFHEPGNLSSNAKHNTLFHRAQVYRDPTYTFGIPGDLNILGSYTGTGHKSLVFLLVLSQNILMDTPCDSDRPS